MMDYVEKLSNLEKLATGHIEEAVTLKAFPWDGRIKQVSANLAKFHPDTCISEHALKVKHAVRDASLLNFSKRFMDESFTQSSLVVDSRFFVTNKPKVILGVHDYTQIVTAYLLSQIEKGIHVFAEDVSVIAPALSPVFERAYRAFSEPDIGGKVVQTGGGLAPYDVMAQCAQDLKSVYSTIDIFSDAFKQQASVRGKLGEYNLVTGLVSYFLGVDYEFFFARSIITDADCICLHIEKLDGNTLSEILSAYVGRLEWFNDQDPMGWEGYTSPRPIC